MPFEVVWSGDTPVITVTDEPIEGLEGLVLGSCTDLRRHVRGHLEAQYLRRPDVRKNREST